MKNFSSFYGEQKNKLFGYLMRLTGDYHLSCDIMQETFTRYFKNYGSDSYNVSLLFTIARNAVWDDAKKRAYRKDQINDFEEEILDPEQQLLIREEYREVMTALHKLEKTERDILSLIISSDLTYRDIASILKISEANVKVKVHRARTRLRDLLKKGEK